jgi:hypothetical protein
MAQLLCERRWDRCIAVDDGHLYINFLRTPINSNLNMVEWLRGKGPLPLHFLVRDSRGQQLHTPEHRGPYMHMLRKCLLVHSLSIPISN